ncbi:hypothetical protein HY479_03890 [Candidatus Uhrbacteria bacterium]|nr:hypothetical protein [Candidatus Uhrbacteria bacterium]
MGYDAPDGDPREDVPRIPDSAFDAARGKPITDPPDAPRSSGSSLIAFNYLIQIEDELGLQFSDETTEEEAGDLKTLMLEGRWLVDEERLRRAIVSTLQRIKPDTYGSDGPWKTTELPELCDVFLAELAITPALMAVADRLRRESPPSRPAPPRRPVSSR